MATGGILGFNSFLLSPILHDTSRRIGLLKFRVLPSDERMRHPFSSFCAANRWRSITWFVLAACLTASTGCTSTMYSAANLPVEFGAPTYVSARHVDLSQIPRTTTPGEWLQAGDTIEVAIATGAEEGATPSWKLTVASNGSVDIPLVGEVPVAGLTPNTAATHIRDEAIRRGFYVNPKVNVTASQKRTFRITVVGAVNEPLTYEIPASGSDLLAALTAAKGLAEDADKIIEIRHTPAALQQQALAQRATQVGGEVAQVSFHEDLPDPTVTVDLSEIEQLPPHMLKLFDGSTVNVRRRAMRHVSVDGLVRKPDKIEMPDGEELTLLEAISQAGGTTISIATKVQIVRRVPESDETIVIEASLSDARSGGSSNIRLADGDIITVMETPATVAVAAIRSFFRVGFSAALPGF